MNFANHSHSIYWPFTLTLHTCAFDTKGLVSKQLKSAQDKDHIQWTLPSASKLKEVHCSGHKAEFAAKI